MKDTIEREAKLSAPTDLSLPDFGGILDGVTAERLPDQELSAVYLDTPDLTLARNAVTLRRRSEVTEDTAEQLWTLKLPAEAGGVGLSRRELSWPARGEKPPREALRLVRAVTFGRPLQPVARVDAKRRRLELRDAGGAGLAEVVDDEVVVVDGDVAAERFREIEVELAAGAPEALLEAVVARLRKAGATGNGGEPKVFRALGAQARKPPDARAGDLDDGSTVRELVASAIARGLGALVDHDAGLRLGGDVEHVHKARVATRRLRSDLRTLRPLLDEGWTGRIRGELKWSAIALGAARDADVLLQRLHEEAAALTEADRGPAQALLDRLSQERVEVNGRLLAMLDSRRYLTLLKDLRAAALDPPLGTGIDGEGKARDVLPRLVRAMWKRVRRHVRALGDAPDDPSLHELRKRAKALRYASEAATPVLDKRAARMARRARALQDVLGELQDGVVAEDWLRSHVAAGDTAQALVAGQLVASQRAVRRASRSSWPKAWRKLRKKKVRSWLSS